MNHVATCDGCNQVKEIEIQYDSHGVDVLYLCQACLTPVHTCMTRESKQLLDEMFPECTDEQELILYSIDEACGIIEAEQAVCDLPEPDCVNCEDSGCYVCDSNIRGLHMRAY